MPVDRSQTLPAALPPTDHVARALLKQGARDDALTLLRAAVARDPGERACAALLRAVEARPDATVGGPDLALDLDVVDAYLRSGMLVEAAAVLHGAGLHRGEEGRWRSETLEELLAPCPPDADEGLREVDRELRTGGAVVALSMLEARIERDAFTPEWARRRHALLSELLLERAEVAPAPPAWTGEVGHSPVGRALADALDRRDVGGALDAARAVAEAHPRDVDARAVVEALERLVDAMTRASADMTQQQMSTQPMKGHTVALFQLRMGNLAEAERYFRKLVLEEPLDAAARQRLDDVQMVRSAVDRGPSAPPGRKAKVDPLLETVRDAPPPAGIVPPSLEEPKLAFKQTMPLADEPTRRAAFDPPVIEDPFSDEPTIPTGPAPDALPVTVEVSLDAVTREVPLHGRAQAEEPRRKPRPSSPELLHKRQRRVTAEPEWAPASHASVDEWEEDSTEVGSPTEQAELLLEKGYADKALQIYETLVSAAPHREGLVRRRDEIVELVRRAREPGTAVGVQLPDADELEAEPTVVSESPLVEAADLEPAEVRVHRIIRID